MNNETTHTIEEMVFLLGESNHQNVMAVSILCPARILILIPDLEDVENLLQSVKSVIKSICGEIPLRRKSIHNIKATELYAFMESELKERGAVSVSTHGSLEQYTLFSAARDLGIPVVCADFEKEQLIWYKKQAVELQPFMLDMNLESILACSGVGIVRHETQMYKENFVSDILEYIIGQYRSFKDASAIIKRKAFTSNTSGNPLWVKVDVSGIALRQNQNLIAFVQYLEKIKMVHPVLITQQEVVFYFHDMKVRNFILKTGSWLEALVYKVISEIKVVDDIKSGVVFCWNQSYESVENEIDVMASIDTRLLCVSCKDTENLETSYLNELQLYAQKLGGENAAKMMVLSTRTENIKFIQRAEQMGIQILFFDGNIDNFRGFMAKYIQEIDH